MVTYALAGSYALFGTLKSKFNNASRGNNGVLDDASKKDTWRPAKTAAKTAKGAEKILETWIGTKP